MNLSETEIEYVVITEQNYPQVQLIYSHGLETRNATFETSVPDWQKWDHSHLQHSRIAIMKEDVMLGWGALTKVSDRCVYEGVAEISVYIHKDFWGQGVGTMIMQKLISESETNGIWSLMSGVFPENKNSIQLHLKEGFRIIGTRERIAQLDGIWRDTVLLQRRSEKIGI